MEGEKNVPGAFFKPYNPNESEPEIIKLWDKSGYANPDVCVKKGVTEADAPAYSIVLPPPNVTGTLHMGHAAMLAIQDILIRYHRMRGDRTLWLPGTDHAAIATQSVVEKDILKTEKKSRHDLGREEFLSRVEKFAQESHDRIVNQIRAMGSSVDWSREAYTLDSARNIAVRTAFKKMYDAGLIYRGKRIVNWDPKMQTTVSDDEIEYVEQKDPFYYFQYGPFVIGTVRPETKFGDKYVVMHPDDARYKKFKHGDTLQVEWINGPITATVIKDEVVDMETGSGVMTITPAHSVVDFEIAEKHKLNMEQIIDERGILLPIAGEFAGEHIKKARQSLVEKMKSKGLLVKVDENYMHNVALNGRGGGIIEPQIKEQWFVDVNKEFVIPHSDIPGIASGSKTTLKDIMRRAVDSGAIKITPERFERIYYNWIDNLRPWCISRQIWYGHRIPVWYKNGETYVGIEAPKGDGWLQDPDTLDTWFSSGLWTFSTLGWPKNQPLQFSKKLGFAGDIVPQIFDSKTKTYRLRDHEFEIGDVVGFEDSSTRRIFGNGTITDIKKTTVEKIDLDDIEHWKTYKNMDDLVAAFKKHHPDREINKDTPVWIYTYHFSPLDTDANDLAIYHPTSVMETGYDILFFWVARMILMTGFCLGTVPFRNVYLHGLVRDGQGRKMSKSLGNIIDPLVMTEKYGADAARLSLIIGASPGNDVKLSEDRVRGYKHFANKIWNISRFVLESSADTRGLAAENAELNAEDDKFVAEAKAIAKQVSEYIDNFRLDLAADAIYHFVWHRFADEIIEESKPILKSGGETARASTQRMLREIFLISLKLLHPFMPFVTEAIWRNLPQKDAELLMVAPWPRYNI